MEMTLVNLENCTLFVLLFGFCSNEFFDFGFLMSQVIQTCNNILSNEKFIKTVICVDLKTHY